MTKPANHILNIIHPYNFEQIFDQLNPYSQLQKQSKVKYLFDSNYYTQLLPRPYNTFLIRMLDQSFDILITQSEFRSLEQKLLLQETEIRRLQGIVKEKEEIIIQLADKLNCSQEKVKNLSINALKMSKKFIEDEEEKQKQINQLKRELSIKDARIKQYSENQKMQKQDLSQIKSRLSLSEQSLKHTQEQKQQKIHQMTFQFLKLQQNLNKLKRAERFRINQQKQQLLEIITHFLNKMQKECNNISQEIIMSNKIFKQIQLIIKVLQNLVNNQDNFNDQQSIIMFKEITKDIEFRNTQIEGKMSFLEGKTQAILIQIVSVRDKL